MHNPNDSWFKVPCFLLPWFISIEKFGPNGLHISSFLSGPSHIRVKQIKTARFKPVEVLLPLPAVSDSIFCAVTALCTLTRSLASNDTLPLFSYITNTGEVKLLTAARFGKYLRSIFSHAGLSAEHYSVHSSRRGAATFASPVDMPVPCLKAQGQWRSSCYQQYITRDDDQRIQFAEKISNAIESTCSWWILIVFGSSEVHSRFACLACIT